MRRLNEGELDAFGALYRVVSQRQNKHLVENTRLERALPLDRTGILCLLPEERPASSQGSGRPPAWTPRVLVTAVFKPDHRTLQVCSLDQYRWGHKNTDQKFPLPALPLSPGMPHAQKVADVATGRGFPSEALSCVVDRRGFLDFSTRGPHGNFDYFKKYDGDPQIWRGIAKTPVRFDQAEAAALEADLFEGTLALIRKLLEARFSGLSSSPLDAICDRVAERTKAMLAQDLTDCGAVLRAEVLGGLEL